MTALQHGTDFAGHHIPRLGMGTMALAIEGRPDRETAIGTIHAALDAGVRYLDTAWSYYLPTAPGTDGTGIPADLGYGETLVRDALASWDGPRDEVLVATKTGYRRTIDTDAAATDVPDGSPRVAGRSTDDSHDAAVAVGASDAVSGPGSADDISRDDVVHDDVTRQRLQAAGSRYGWMADSRPETMIRDAKESAMRLGVDALDLLYSHGPDPAVPYEDQMGALRTLLDEGVIRYAGISRVDNAQIDVARAILGDGLIAVQNQFSPSHPDPEHTMAHCAELGLDFVCWSPLGGFLDPFDQAAYDPFRKVAAARGVSYQRVVLAWELTRYDRLFAIPSARNPHEINDSFAAINLRLTPEELAVLG
ncbi:aldo/keto reductase [Bifidobacterium amazonense]|uniref:Aldo/keto reductase n=1 Tax=Bifidobacterium amazonense TaxID=2809027 RepID=A0ABS9VXJ1_9BIFI|nr:aldo/keto reductase [Bifidobacterium amazonense]MCH9276812.1 aldo/keto reductase [Bifidobacterium amazonense]